jgi:hypothetical protein
MMARMTVPDWRTSTRGARVRVAMWLHAEVGTNGVFTKAQLRSAFPSIEQIDRRMRDLRPEGWVIATYREDASLAPDELRLVQLGGPVWDPSYRSKVTSTLSDKERQTIFAADNYMCVYCGVSGGETYVDDPLRTAKLTVSRVPSADGQSIQLATSCDRCHVATRDDAMADDLGPALLALSGEERTRLLGWIRKGARPSSIEARLWARYRRLPLTARLEAQRQLEAQED